MAWALFLLVACIWAVFLLPPLWADRRSSSMSPTRRFSGVAAEPARVGRPSRDTYHISGGTGGVVESGPDRARILSRRRRVIVILVATAVGALAAWSVFGGLWLLGLQVASDAVLIWYLVMLRGIAKRRRAAESLRAMSQQEDESRYSPRVRVVESR